MNFYWMRMVFPGLAVWCEMVIYFLLTVHVAPS